VVSRDTKKQIAPTVRIKKKTEIKRSERRSKAKKAYIAWKDNEMSSLTPPQKMQRSICV